MLSATNSDSNRVPNRKSRYAASWPQKEGISLKLSLLGWKGEYSNCDSCQMRLFRDNRYSRLSQIPDMQ